MNRIISRFALLACLLPLSGAQAFPDRFDPFDLDPEQKLTVTLPQLSAPQTRSFARQPLCFERNDGQTDSSVAFVSRGRGHTLFLAKDEVVMALHNPLPQGGKCLDSSAAAAQFAGAFGEDEDQEALESPEFPGVLRMRPFGANPLPAIEGEDNLRATANYFIGNQPAFWRTNIPTFGKVHYREVYPGIDLMFYGYDRQLEYDFVVAPGADPTRIILEFEGADELRLDAAGDLVLTVRGWDVRWQRPRIYQDLNGVRHEVAGQYRLGVTPTVRGSHCAAVPSLHFVSFVLAAYDATRPLVIDPRLVYSTYVGGSGDDDQTVAVDKQGNVYVAGTTASINFPTKAALRSSAPGGDSDALVAKFDPAGQLVFSTYLGGTARESLAGPGEYWVGGGIAFTAAGDCYVVGATQSRDFPLVNPLQAVLGGNDDVFVATLKSDGSTLLFSTYLGGKANDQPLALRVGPGDDLYLSGFTDSTDFPTTNAFQPRLSSPSEGWQQPDGFLVRLEAGGKRLRYSTYFGRFGLLDRASGLELDAEGNVYVAVLAARFGGGQWVVAKISPDGHTRLFERRWPPVIASYPIDQLLGPPQLALAPNGRLVLAAYVELDGELLPAINEPDPSIYTWSKIYIALFDSMNGDYISAAYLGGTGNNSLGGLCVDAAGDIIVAGDTSGQNFEPSGFPITDPIEPSPDPGLSGDVFIARYRSSDLSLVLSTLLGGPGGEGCSGLALDPDGSLWVAGQTSGGFPTANAFQSESAGANDAFLAKISLGERLQISLAGQSLRISWPAQATDYVLEAATSLPAVSWDAVTNTPTVNATERSVQLSMTGNARFFRLRKQ